MSVIQSIRDKGAKISVILIALSLVGFILMDAFTGRSNMFGGNSTTLGSVNGKKIDYIDFNKKYSAEVDGRQQQGYPMDDRGRQQVGDYLWNQEVTKILAESEFDKLGITVGKSEINDMLFGKNPPADLRQIFTDPKTNMYDGERARQIITQLKRSKNETERKQLAGLVESMEYNRMIEKYSSLFTNSVNIPRWFVEKQSTENSQIAKISYVKIPYTSVADSTVKVTDAEIADYISKHKEDFKQDQETRSIEYVSFNAGPTQADSNAVRDQLAAMKSEFETTKDAATFVVRNNTAIKFFDAYMGKSQIKQASKDSIIAQPLNGIYGPYLDANAYVLAKLLEVKQLPDSVTCRHILIATTDVQTGQQLVPDSIAKQKADSIATAIKSGANFDSLETKYSTDKVAHEQKGVMKFSSTDIQGENFDQDFAKFILFDGKAGDKKVVKTKFGYHYIDIMDQRNFEPHYKIAYLAREIYPSQETDNNALNQANQFAANSQDRRSFDENFEKTLKAKGINKLLAIDIRPTDASVNQVLVSRPLVKAIFNARKDQTINEAFHIGDNYIVVNVTDVNEGGTQSVTKARPFVETILIKKKKAQLLVQKIGKVNTLEEVSTAQNQPVQTADSLRMTGGSFGFEPRVIGAAFNAANNGKVVPELIEGTEGVFALKVDNLSATPVANANIEDQRKQLAQTLQQRQGYPTQILMKVARIKDNRSKFF